MVNNIWTTHINMDKQDVIEWTVWGIFAENKIAFSIKVRIIINLTMIVNISGQVL